MLQNSVSVSQETSWGSIIKTGQLMQFREKEVADCSRNNMPHVNARREKNEACGTYSNYRALRN
jgi:hypothetical protein